MTAVHSVGNSDLNNDRDESTLAQEIKEQLKSAPWYLGSIFAHMIVIVLLLLVPKTPKPVTREKIIIYTDIVKLENKVPDDYSEKPDEPLDMDNIVKQMEGRQENKLKFTNPVFEGYTKNHGIALVDLEFNQQGHPDDKFEKAENYKPSLVAIRAGVKDMLNLPARGIENMAENIKVNLDNKPSKDPGILLVWLLDQSASMKDDQLTIASKALDIQDLLSEGGSKKMLSAVVTFGKHWNIAQPPTGSSAKIEEKIKTVPVDRSGIENTNQAIIYTCQSIMSRYSGYTKVIVLLSDESSSDQYRYYQKSAAESFNTKNAIRVSEKNKKYSFLELALKNLKKTDTRLFVIGKESPFQSNYARENLIDEQGRQWKYLRVDRGPESPRIEVPVMYSRNVSPYVRSGFTGDLKSGFGVYDLSYLAKGSKGAYFILEKKFSKLKRALTFSERLKNPLALDWKTMESYRPKVISRIYYDRYISENCGRYGKTLVTLNSFYAEHGRKIMRWDRAQPPSTFDQRISNLRLRKKVISKIINYISRVRASDKELLNSAYKRQIANIDLYYCVALADEIITDAWLTAWESYRGTTENYKVKGWRSCIIVTPEKGAELNSARKKAYNKRISELYKACNEVIRRHPNTPYAKAASWIPAGPKCWAVPASMIYKKWKHVVVRKLEHM